MSSTLEQDIFNKGSTTYYWSSKFFPKSVREDVFKLYSFVRVVDDNVDSIPQQKEEYFKIKNLYLKKIGENNFDTTTQEGDAINVRVVKNLIYVSRKYSFDGDWVISFFDSMEMDINKKSYKTIEEVESYIYGSAEVIGLMMSKIMGLDQKSFKYAQLQGRAMQWINFLRDVDEDLSLGRVYLPEDDLRKFGFNSFNKETITGNPEEFSDLIKFEISRYEEWQKEAYKGYEYIPKRLRVPLKTATDMYNWTSKLIKDNPMIVFDKKVKPRKRRVILGAGANLING
jgi:phytoene synthase